MKDTEQTRVYLAQLKSIDKRIKYKLEEAAKWRNIAENHSSHLSDVKVQSSPNQDKMADAIVKAMQFEQDSYALADKMVAVKKAICEQIDSMGEKDYIMLNLYFVQNKTYKEIESELDCSYNKVKAGLREAIKRFGTKYSEEIKTFIADKFE